MSEREVADERYRVGYALQPKKVESFIQPSLHEYASNHGIDLIQIDPNTPLQQQAPFHCIIHKLYTPHWTKHLQQFSALNPNTPIIDPPDLIHRLHNRLSMLHPLSHSQISLQDATLGVPNQLLLQSSHNIQHLPLRFPAIAKPLAADGGAGSHELRLVFDREGLTALTLPTVLQEFVNHGGVLFKIYVAGRRVRCVKRKSLPDISEEELRTLKGAVPFSRVSDSGVEDGVDSAEMPPQSLVDELARALREALGLNLFNVDVIRDANEPARYLVIDINYFPGYAKLPSYEPFITHFLLDVVRAHSA
ncbi:hypothetical protein Fmac_026210 [Flemingia macrophylla]|uniref:Inositol-tetrakisphosphate 1-kinase n=1 Tax=Flemingia macrophylla TaxID=520843 RepID=A0ABD1LEE0_9FABA